jgi:hypothetical protein
MTSEMAMGFEMFRAVEGQFLETPGLTLQQARDRRALRLAVEDLLSDLVARDVLARRQSRPSVRTDPSRAVTPRQKHRDA